MTLAAVYQIVGVIRRGIYEITTKKALFPIECPIKRRTSIFFIVHFTEQARSVFTACLHISHDAVTIRSDVTEFYRLFKLSQFISNVPIT